MLVMTLGVVLLAPLTPQAVPSATPPPPVAAEAAPPEEPGAEEVAPDVPTISLSRAVALALERNFGLLNSADALATSQLRENVSFADFYPRFVPRFERSSDNTVFGMDATQRLPWSGGRVTASASLREIPEDLGPFPRSSDVRVTLTQPLLRGFGPNATFFDLRNSRRGRERSSREYELTRQRVAEDVARSFFQVIQQRQLLAVARQSAKRSESLRKASQARLEVGLVSKLDVYRAELQESQAQESMVRAETSLESELERFRTLLGLSPTEPLQPEAVRLPDEVEEVPESIEELTKQALANRLDLQETRDQVDDARRSASLARQNLLPQVDLSLAMSLVGFGTSFGTSLSSADRRVNLFVTTSYPLERSSEAANKATAERDLVARQRTFQQRQLEVEAEVRGAVRELARIKKSIELQKKGVEVAEQQRRLATLRYQRGLASNFDVVDAEGSLVLARSALVGLLTSYQVARIDLLRVTGTLDVQEAFER